MRGKVGKFESDPFTYSAMVPMATVGIELLSLNSFDQFVTDNQGPIKIGRMICGTLSV